MLSNEDSSLERINISEISGTTGGPFIKSSFSGTVSSQINQSAPVFCGSREVDFLKILIYHHIPIL